MSKRTEDISIPAKIAFVPEEPIEDEDENRS